MTHRSGHGRWGLVASVGVVVRAWLLCGLVLAAGTLRAQVWGYVDERGVAHFSAERLDGRYELFYRGEGVVRPRWPVATSSQAQAQTSGWETPALTGVHWPEPTGAVVAPPALLAFFEVSPSYKAVRHHIREAAQRFGVPPELLSAVIATESGFDARAVSYRGAVGLMQVMPATALAQGLSEAQHHPVETLLVDPRTNIHAGARHLARLLTLFPESLELALAAYNAGEGAVRRAGRRVPDYPETRRYVRTVMQLYQHLLPPRALQGRGAATGPRTP